MKKFLFIALAAIAVFVGCNKESALYYGMMTMGQVSGNGNIVTDGGLTYVITENNSEGDYTSLGRIMILCDVLEQLEGENTFSIRLQDYSSVVISTTVKKSEILGDEESLGTDAINMKSGWFSGGYLNVYATMTMIQDSQTAHNIRLMFNDTVDNSDTLHFYLKHNGHGETFETAEDKSKIVEAGGYLSFPVSGLIPSDVKGINVRIDWDWYKTVNGQYSTETEHHYQTGYYQAEEKSEEDTPKVSSVLSREAVIE